MSFPDHISDKTTEKEEIVYTHTHLCVYIFLCMYVCVCVYVN